MFTNSIFPPFVFIMDSIAIYNAFLFFLLTLLPSTPTRVLSIIYIFQCCFRSIFVSNYLTQQTTTEFFLNSPLLARLLASVGETCFVVQLVLFFNSYYESTFLSSYIILSNVYAQIVSTIGTVNKESALFVTEGMFWAQIFASLAIWSYLICVFHVDEMYLFSTSFILCANLAMYMICVYIPYVYKATPPQIPLPDTIGGKIMHAFGYMEMCTEWYHWKDEASWQIPYFILGPSISVFLLLQTEQSN